MVRSQPLIAVSDVEVSSRWYRTLLGCKGDDAGHGYCRLEADGNLILQLHEFGVDHHHGPIGDPLRKPYGNGVLVWFEVDDFDGIMQRAAAMNAEIIMPKHRNPAPNHWECWLRDPDGYSVVIASPDNTA